ncbi:BREX-2 system adenine-specific DNA-methyltransferase PglX [Streptomyces sp. RGM 3693]|uniref:BREX-2 system adenine-specific DNA-methyltransferase PglX n=1 Tax=Streptomyces sp. RGM 3693 TaxID=3413284 RepID=UPI003D2C7D63
MSARTGGQDGLLKDLRKQVTHLEDDLRARSESVEEYRDRLTDEYTRAFAAGRTAAIYEPWRDERITQVAAAWVLGCLFVRFCEDNRLIARPWLAGAGERLKDAEDHDAAFFATNPEKNDRDWIIAAFDHLAETNPTVAGLFDRAHNPLWEIEPSYEAASALLKFWRRVGSDGEIIHSFTDENLDTRFLGDLYQDLSSHARDTYALLQTPVFVEEFILDMTLDTAVAEFGLEPVVSIHEADGSIRELPAGLRTIDPTCGSGHFLLGLFERLLTKWRDADKTADDWTLIRRALNAVHGCDKNPFAVAIARFRLLIAVMKAAGERQLNSLKEFPLHIAVGDSLLYGRGSTGIQEDLFSTVDAFQYKTEDAWEHSARCDLLGRSTYHLVVGNPPYIEVADPQENKNYRAAFGVCVNKYPLSVPFIQRFFELAIRPDTPDSPAGLTGQITSNSFMKRNPGKKVIENFLPTVNLTHVIDTSYAHIPGHNREGTPTVILIGSNESPSRETRIRIVSGNKGETPTPKNPKKGKVWLELTSHTAASYPRETEWASSSDTLRTGLAKHPWALHGGELSRLTNHLRAENATLKSVINPPIGRAIRAGADEAFVRPLRPHMNTFAPKEALRPFMTGKVIRDWSADPAESIWYPYHKGLSPEVISRELWPLRSTLAERRTFKGNMASAELNWWEYMQHTPSAYATPLSIIFAFKASRNHFSLDRGGNVFNRHSPAIKLPAESTLKDHYSLTAILNSSTSCLLMRESSQHQGGGAAEHPWSWTFEFTGGMVERLPIPNGDFSELGHSLDMRMQELSHHEPSSQCSIGNVTPTRDILDAARLRWECTREQMISLQEELDWSIYHAFGLLDDADKKRLTIPNHEALNTPRVKLGERAFEIILARKLAAGEVETAWFHRHGSEPVTVIPEHWPDWYRSIVQERIDAIIARPDISLIERPEYKRRWEAEPWENRERFALRGWLLDRCEKRALWFHVRNGFEQPRTLTVGQLADELEKQTDADSILNIASLYAAHLGKPNLSLQYILQDVLDAEHVPYLAAYRYTDSGLLTHKRWEWVWEFQRKADYATKSDDIQVPPPFGKNDFAKQSYWSNRGKFDVPKERFVSYPDASPGSDPTLLLGWAGWDQRDQATALLNIVSERRKQQDWSGEQLVPLLAGISELMPWLRQWFSEVDDEWGEESAAEEFQSFLDGELAREHLTPAALTEWRPAKKIRVRKATATAKAAKKKAAEDDE